MNRTKIIVIGNYYDENKRSSTTFICLPKGWSDQELYESNKITKSDYDKEVLRDVSQRKILKICWKPNNQEKYGYFQILTCKDFLYFTSIEGIKNTDMNEALKLVRELELEKNGFCIVIVDYSFIGFGEYESGRYPIVCNEKGDPYWESWQFYENIKKEIEEAYKM